MTDTTNGDYDYSEYTAPDPQAGSNPLAMLYGLAQEQADAEADVARLEAELEKAREKLKDISERRLPDAMDEIGMADFTTSSGLKILIEEKIRCSIPKAVEDQAFGYLRANGLGSLIKRKVSVEFGKGEDEQAADLVKWLVKNYESTEDKSSVHPSTLTSVIKGKLEDGEEFPQELFGVFRQRASVIDRPKPKKTRKGKE